MKKREAMQAALESSGLTKRALAQRMGVHDQHIKRYIESDGVKAESMLSLLQATGYRVYAVPDTIRLEGLLMDALPIDAQDTTQEDSDTRTDA